MTKLTADDRKHLPASDFGLPDTRQYPMPDAAHARDAKARASAEEHRGHINAGQEKKIDAKADRVLDEKSPSK